MKVTYIGRRRRAVVPHGDAAPFTAEPGASYELPAPVAKSLLEQPRHWTVADEPTPANADDTKED